MKKWGIFFSIFVCLILISAINCKSPETTEAAAPFIAANAESNSTSNSNTNAGGGEESSERTTTALGSLIVKMKDKPVKDADQIWVKISNIVVHMADPDEFIEVSDVEQDFDLLELRDNPASIVTANLEAGHYNQIRMDVVEGSIVFLEDVGEPDLVEVTYDLKVPSNEIKIPVQFYIEESGETEIILDFDTEKSIHVTQQGKKDSYKLRPVIKVIGVNYQ